MRIYSSQYKMVASEILRTLAQRDLIELEEEMKGEAELDIISVIREYNRITRQIRDQARDQAYGGDYGEINRVQRRLARDRGVKLGDEAIGYVVEQLIETLLASPNFEEIYATDRELRVAITPIIQSHSRGKEDELDAMVRSRIQNLEEGSSAWDIEYERMMNTLREKRGLHTDD